MRSETRLNTGWRFAEGFDPGWTGAAMSGAGVTLPHNAVDLPISYFDETAFQRVFTYQRAIDWQDDWQGRLVQLRFDAAMADASVWVNGQPVAHHRDGYTPFIADLTPHLRPGENLVTVRIDGTENPLIRPLVAGSIT